jgi:hypothetical protein
MNINEVKAIQVAESQAANLNLLSQCNPDKACKYDSDSSDGEE